MWSSSRRVLQELIIYSPVKCFSQTTCKNTVIVERWWQVPLSKQGRPPRLYSKRHRVYKLVEDTRNAPKEKMELLLTQTVDRLGGRGDTVFVKKSVGRYKLLPQGLAVYPSQENKEKFTKGPLLEATSEEKRQTRTGEMTVEHLKCTELRISKPLAVDYQLTKDIVCRHFVKKLGIVVPPHALRLPDEPIGELGDYWCDVTVNGLDTVRVPLSLLPYVDPSASHQRELKSRMKEQAELAATGAIATEAIGAAIKGEAILEAVAEPAPVVVESLVVPGEASTIPGAASAPESRADSYPIEAAAIEPTAASPAPEEATAASPALEEATAASPAPEEATAASPAPEEATAASPAPEKATAAPPALEEVTAAPPAPEEAIAASPAPEEVTAASPAAEEVTAASPAPEEATAASPALEEVTAASPAVEEVTAASPAPDEATAASPAPEEVTTASPALEEVTAASPAAEEVTAASPAPDEATAASPAPEEVTTASPAPEEATAASPAPDEATAASPAPEEVTAVSPVLEEVTAAPPALEEATAVSPALEEAKAAKVEKTATSPEDLDTPQTTESKAIPPSETLKKD